MHAMRREATLADAVGAAGLTRDLILIGVASALTGLAAQLEIRLPFTPVPVTLQPLAVFLCGAALGSRRAALAMLLYLAEGAAGLPVFAGGAAGLTHLAGPTGGYLLGFVPAAFTVGFCAERGWDRTPLGTCMAMGAGSLVLYACGVAQLAAYVGHEAALASGFYPFVAGDLLKIAVAAGFLPALWKLLERARLVPRP